MYRKLLTLFLFLLFVTFSYSQTLNLRFNSHVYAWQRADLLNNADTNKTRFIRGYQNLLLEVTHGKISLNTLLQTDEEITGKNGDAFNFRAYSLYIKGTNLLNHLDFKLGRQYTYAGVGRGTIDGLSFKVKAGKNKQYQFTAYGGILTPLDYTFKKYGKLKENYLLGGMFSYYTDYGLTASLSYSRKNKIREPFTYVRIDSLFNGTNYTFDLDPAVNQLAGIDINYDYQNLGKYYGYVKAYLNLGNFEKVKAYKVEVNGRAKVGDKLTFSAGYTFNDPLLSFNTIFWVFNHKENHEIEGGIDYNFFKDFYANVRASYLIYNNDQPNVPLLSESPSDNSLRLQAGISNSNYGVQYTRYMGYSGESDGFYLFANRQIVEKLTMNLSASYSNYRLGDFSSVTDTAVTTIEKLNSFMGVLGIVYRPLPQLSIDLQGQYLYNKVYKSDARFLVGFNYWLFKNFSR